MTLDDRMKQNIKNYANEIITIEEFVNAVRQNPGQFIGYLGNKGFINMIREIFQNATDEMGKADSPCDHVSLFYDEKTHRVTVADNGRGIPYDNIIRIFTSEHTSSNYVKKAGEFSSGLHGVGSKVTNALSAEFVVESYILGEGRTVEFYNGVPWDKGELKIKNENNMQGTIVSFIPSDIMGEITVSWRDVLHLVKLLLPETNIGAVVYFEAIDVNGNRYEEKCVNDIGILAHLRMSNPVVQPITMSAVSDTMKADIAFSYDSDNLGMEQIISFSNLCPTIAGTHVDGFLDGITKFFRDYMNKIYLANSKKKNLQVTSVDIKTGLRAVISVAHIKPIFNGQAKEILANDDMVPFVKDLVIQSLNNWIKAQPGDLQKICKYFKDVAELRLKSDESKVKLSSNYKANTLSGKPKKYLPPNGKKNLELIIVEGDSAMGSVRNDRDPNRQGVFPIRGKIPNAFNTSKAEFLKNEEISSILTIFGCGYGKNFDISRFPFDKVIIATDADADGAHIRALLFRFFILYCAPVITNGKLYGAQPPLFGMKLGRGKGFKYFATKIDFIKYTQNIFLSKNTVLDEHNRPIRPIDMTGILIRNMDYQYELEKLSNTYSVDPELLEYVLAFPNDIKYLKKLLKSKYRFINVEVNNGILTVTGLASNKYQNLFLTPSMFNKASRVLKYINESPFYYNVNGQKMTLYNLMKSFKQSYPSIIRYKGLGEMDGDQLAESTLHPDMGRSLIRYTIEDVKQTIEEVREIESNRYALLQNTENLTRFDID